MIIRNYQNDDFEQFKTIHERYYKEEFSLAEFYENFLQSFVVVEDDKIIIAGGIRTIAESVIMTDKAFSVRQRREALLLMLQAQTFVTNKKGYNKLHAFVQDSHWLDQLIEYGFKECKGKPIYIGV